MPAEIEKDTNTIIEDSLRAADPDFDIDARSGDEEEPVVEEAVEEVAEEPVAEVEEPVVEEPVAASADPLAQELADLGIHAPKAGERENRLPYSRMSKIFSNAKKKWAETHAGELKTVGDKLTAAEVRTKQMDQVDKLIVSDPDRYVGELARIHPALYGKFLHKPEPAVVAAPLAEKAPAPDATYPDGSVGYSPEGLQKLMEWNRQQGAKDAIAETEKIYTKRFGPIEQQYKAQQIRAERLPVVRKQIADATKVWGELFTKNEDSITKYLADNPEVPFAQAVASVLVPLAQANRDTMRSDLLKEINARPKAAVRTAPAAVGARRESANRSTTDVIRQSLADAGLS